MIGVKEMDRPAAHRPHRGGGACMVLRNARGAG